MRQLTFGFTPQFRYVIQFPFKVKKELLSLMARAISEAVKNTEGVEKSAPEGDSKALAQKTTSVEAPTARDPEACHVFIPPQTTP